MKLTAFLSGLAFSALSLLPAKAATCYLLTQGSHILTFDSASPGTISNDVATSGTPADYGLVGIAMRTTTQPASSNAGVGSVWGILLNFAAGKVQLCTVEPSTGVVTPLGSPVTVDVSANADGIGFGFDPASDRFRYTSGTANYEVNPNTLTFTRQTDLSSSYNRGAAFTPTPYGGVSTFYNFTQTTGAVLQKSTNITKGTLSIVSGLVIDSNTFVPLGLAINGTTGFAAIEGSLYTLNLSAGSATGLQSISGSPTVRGLVVVPSSFPPKLAISVKISGPKKVTTSAASRVVKGSVSSNAGVTKVEYRVGTKGKFKTAKGTTKWKFTAKLKSGKNVISVRATTGSTTSKIAKVTITRK